MRWTLHTVARKKQDTRTQRDRRVCVAGAWVCACRLRVRERQMRWRVVGHGGKCERVRCGEKNGMQIAACLLAVLETGDSSTDLSSWHRSSS